MARFCANCGSRVADGQKFCTECGDRVDSASGYAPPGSGYSAPGSGYSPSPGPSFQPSNAYDRASPPKKNRALPFIVIGVALVLILLLLLLRGG